MTALSDVATSRPLHHRAFDLSGQVFSSWTVLGPATSTGGAMRWSCRCKCGEIKDVASDLLRHGRSKGCRKCYIAEKSLKAQDLTGEQFGRWTVVRRSDRVTSNRQLVHWVCRCECGATGEVTRSNLIGGHSLGCWDCGRAATRLDISIGDCFGSFRVAGGPVYRGELLLYECECTCGVIRRVTAADLINGRRHRCKSCTRVAQNGPWNLMFARIRKRAESRGFEFALTLEFIIDLLDAQDYRCKLSGLPIAISDKTRNGTEGTASLDRIDSRIGYTLENVQWVHKRINKMKQNLPDEEFVGFCRAVAAHHDR